MFETSSSPTNTQSEAEIMAYKVFNKEQKGKKSKVVEKVSFETVWRAWGNFFAWLKEAAFATWGMRYDAMRKCNATWLDASQTAA